MRELSERFPETTFELLAGYRTGERAIELGEIVADEPGPRVDSLCKHPAIEAFERLESAGGRVLGHTFERRSGNATYDAALERAIAAARLPPPPPELRERFRSTGLGVNFHH